MISSIESDTDLKKALDRFDELWSVRPGDPDWEEREELVDLIVAYEDDNVVMDDDGWHWTGK